MKLTEVQIKIVIKMGDGCRLRVTHGWIPIIFLVRGNDIEEKIGNRTFFSLLSKGLIKSCGKGQPEFYILSDQGKLSKEEEDKKIESLLESLKGAGLGKPFKLK